MNPHTKKNILAHIIPLPEDIVNQIDKFLGEERYWNARYQLTLYNARLNLFQSDWWYSWYTYIRWYHWYERNPNCQYHSLRDCITLLSATYIPYYCAWVVDDDTRVRLILRLFKLSLRDHRLLNTVSLQLRINIEYWRQVVKQYRQIVYH